MSEPIKSIWFNGSVDGMAWHLGQVQGYFGRYVSASNLLAPKAGGSCRLQHGQQRAHRVGQHLGRAESALQRARRASQPICGYWMLHAVY